MVERDQVVDFEDLDDEAKKDAMDPFGVFEDLDPTTTQREINKAQLVATMAEKGQAVLDKMAARGDGEQELALPSFKGMRGIPTMEGTHWHDSAGGDVVLRDSTPEAAGVGTSTYIAQDAVGETLQIKLFPVHDGKRVEGKDSVFNFRPDSPASLTEVAREGGMVYPKVAHSIDGYNPDDPQAGDMTYPAVAQAFLTNAAMYLDEGAPPQAAAA